ncbi:MAG: ABC transporter substrate-binding protein [Rhizobacter sp.]
MKAVRGWWAVALGLLIACAHARPVTDAHGTIVEVPARPQRVVVLSELDLDALLALGLRPVATTSGRGQVGVPRYLEKAAAGIPVIGSFGAPVLDQLLSAQPDLILAGGVPDPGLLAQLRKVAPTVVSFKPGEDWKLALQRVATIVDRLPAAQTVLARAAERSAAARTRLGPQAASTVSVVRWNPQGPAYMLADSFASRVLADLRLARPPAQREPGAGHSPPLSLEALDRIDGDWLFIGTLSASGQARSALDAARRSAAFGQLQAVRRNHAVIVDGSLWTGLGGPLAAMAVIDDVERAMAPVPQ